MKYDKRVRALRSNSLKDLTGQKFGELTVTGYAGKIACNSYWKVRCSCGVEKEIAGSGLKTGRVHSCGCRSREWKAKGGRSQVVHGKTRTKIHYIWQAMKQRCQNPKNAAYKNYGGRGITVCNRWESFENFYKDMGDPPPKLTLERRNNEKGYSPGNCYWATRKEQYHNSRRNKNYVG